MIGDPEKDKALLRDVSSIFHVNQIKAPLFIAQGANDPRVKKAESDQIVEALKKRHVDVPYMVKDNEGHGFHNEENRFDFYRAMRFFKYSSREKQGWYFFVAPALMRKNTSFTKICLNKL